MHLHTHIRTFIENRNAICVIHYSADVNRIETVKMVERKQNCNTKFSTHTFLRTFVIQMGKLLSSLCVSFVSDFFFMFWLVIIGIFCVAFSVFVLFLFRYQFFCFSFNAHFCLVVALFLLLLFVCVRFRWVIFFCFSFNFQFHTIFKYNKLCTPLIKCHKK